MRFAPLCLALLLPAAAHAGPDRISVLLGSEHFNATEDFQEFNPGLFLTWEGSWDVSVGAYYNSYEEVGALVSVGRDFWQGENYAVGAFGALALYPGDGDRFDIAVGDVVPLIGLQARYGNVFTQLIPGNGETTDGVLTFGLTFELP
ncbi:hypothetical protein [uncultured Roseobacter sp.]|uniref:hypothetical protein n=1 Tax=uncultured Roseobacter sp. TaxID=114847 RepID=UPI0026281DA2|nr:hypothetical protein [uncultured Roseobacter sp.]